MTTTPVIVTRDSLTKMITNPNAEYVKRVLGKALVAIFKRQTEAEQTTDSTQNDNGVGFAGCDARSGSLTAKFFMKHNTLADWQVAAWTRVGKNGYARICKYHAQLNEIATSRPQRTASL